jgi:hypothetical protein
MKKSTRPPTDYFVLTAGALSLAGACIAFYYDKKHMAIKSIVVLTAIILISLLFHTLTKSDPKWRSVGLRHSPGRVVFNLMMFCVIPASAMSILVIWVLYLSMAALPISIIWMTSSLLINTYATLEVIKHMDWV